jgi:hypothetical protein
MTAAGARRARVSWCEKTLARAMDLWRPSQGTGGRILSSLSRRVRTCDEGRGH